jgi:hypothetical protein
MKGTRFLFSKQCFITIVIAAIVPSAFAAEKRKPAQATQVQEVATPANPAAVAPSPAPLTAPAEGDFNHWFVSAVFSPIDYWVTGKYGAVIAYIPSPSHMYEFEYLRGTFSSPFTGVDLGSSIEQRLSIQTRYFVTESFNYHAGMNYNFAEIKLKNSYTSTVFINPRNEQYDIIELSTLGVQLGVGNRWFLDNGMEIGVDWIQVAMPLIRTYEYSPFTDLTSDRHKSTQVSDAISRMRDNPRFAVAKIQFGISF